MVKIKRKIPVALEPRLAPNPALPRVRRAVRGTGGGFNSIVPLNRASLSSALQEPLSALQGGEGGTPGALEMRHPTGARTRAPRGAGG